MSTKLTNAWHHSHAEDAVCTQAAASTELIESVVFSQDHNYNFSLLQPALGCAQFTSLHTLLLIF